MQDAWAFRIVYDTLGLKKMSQIYIQKRVYLAKLSSFILNASSALVYNTHHD